MTARTLILSSLLVSGCGGLIARHTYEGMSAEEIRAIHESGLQIVKCTGIGGPPLGGRTVIVSYPRNATGRVSFSPGPDCAIREADIDLRGTADEEQVEAPKPFKIDPNEFNPKPRVVQPPPKLKSDFKILETPSGKPAIRISNGTTEAWDPGAPVLWEVPKPDPCNFIGATGARWVNCK